ncbi:MAG: hypothetical protein K8R31_11905 [Bacteroidales bacterium]|nr:hypothetical protein [Bacteroidales bacterium]
MKKLYLLILGIVIYSSVIAQKVGNVNSTQDGNKIKVTYQINDAGTNQSMDINLYYSINDNSYNGPLQKVTGDVGSFVSGNGTKIIVWDVISETGSLDGNVKFKVEVLPKEDVKIPIVSNGDMNGTVESCVLSGNSIYVTFILNSSIDYEWFFIPRKTFIFNEYGEKFSASSFRWGNNKETGLEGIDLINNTPFKITYVFENINVNSKIVKAVQISDYSNKFTLQFRDIPVIKK